MPSSRDQSHDSSLEDPTRSVNPRLNGWECPWHPFQVLHISMTSLLPHIHYRLFPGLWYFYLQYVIMVSWYFISLIIGDTLVTLYPTN